MSAQQQLLDILQYKIQHDKLVLPTLPDIALKVRQRSGDSDVSLLDMADVIAQDPALAARMIKVSNSAFMGRSIKVSTLNQAVTRIGLSQIRNIAIAMALEQVFLSKHKQVQQQLDTLWHNSIQVASTAVACLSHYNRHEARSGLNKDVLTLIALVHNIGALPIVAEAEREQELLGDPRFLQHLAQSLSADVSVRILQAWGFGEEFHQTALTWRKIQPQRPGPGYTDFIRLAVIARDGYADKALQKKLLQHYVTLQLVPQEDFMQHPDIQAVYQDVRAIFS
ncbi:HDOD domain-containing protein [Rheinheimera maricola]|uniref:HDOD domain-containing protein n=1 Tax=Rheinheimera maricola TaxID=2793282 RepID=A0ABS7X6D6_9GAMM|nr:HDOD domain-containing protein [Rheinheimera maricola]MBZ9611109.1 HDOD domain-containing protein [Rheinheimera maricola]